MTQSNHTVVRLVAVLCVGATILVAGAHRSGQAQGTFSPYVDARGGITVPSTYRERWVFLGAWSIAAGADGEGAKGLHNVYTQPGVVEAYRRNGEFPDGTVLVKELLRATTRSMTTGTVSHGADVEGWFVMIKDAKNRFPDNSLWGDGWGWAFFGTDNMLTTKDYEVDCKGCHVPAKETDWIYVDGYPVLR